MGKYVVIFMGVFQLMLIGCNDTESLAKKYYETYEGGNKERIAKEQNTLEDSYSLLRDDIIKIIKKDSIKIISAYTETIFGLEEQDIDLDELPSDLQLIMKEKAKIINNSVLPVYIERLDMFCMAQNKGMMKEAYEEEKALLFPVAYKNTVKDRLEKLIDKDASGYARFKWELNDLIYPMCREYGAIGNENLRKNLNMFKGTNGNRLINHAYLRTPLFEEKYKYCEDRLAESMGEYCSYIDDKTNMGKMLFRNINISGETLFRGEKARDGNYIKFNIPKGQ